jgi:hypothetical protein
VGSVLSSRRGHRNRPRRSTPPPRSRGPTLEDLLARGPLTPDRTLELLDQVAAELDATHARGIAHPDLQPARVLLDASRGDRAMLHFDADPPDQRPLNGRPRAGASLQYVSPERIRGSDAGPRSDVYSLSALLYRCLTGSVPFPRGHDRAVLFWHLHAPRPRATTVLPDLPPAIDRVLARGMAIAPGSRQPTTRALLDDARQALGLDRRPTRSAQRAKRAGGGRRRLVPLAMVIALAAAAGGYAIAGLLDHPSPPPEMARAGRLRLVMPADWKHSSAPAAVARLRLTDPVVLAPTHRSEAVLIAGTATAADSVQLLSHLHASRPSGELVGLPRAQARRYRAERPPGLSGPATLYVVPMDRGVATVACLVDRAPSAASFMASCERATASLRLASGSFAPAGPSDRQASRLIQAMQRLNAARSRYRSRLERARGSGAQATAARALARDELREARTLRSLGLVGLARPGGHAAVRSLELSASAYRTLAKAAADQDRRGYRTARRAVVLAEARIRHALRALRAVGFAV